MSGEGAMDRSEQVAQQVKETLAPDDRVRRQVTGASVRAAAFRAVKGTHSIGGGANNLARETAQGAVKAVGEIGGARAVSGGGYRPCRFTRILRDIVNPAAGRPCDHNCGNRWQS